MMAKEYYGTKGQGKGIIKSVTGVEDTIQRIRNIRNEAIRNLSVATLAGATVVNDDAKARAPVRTGNLRRSIHPELGEYSSERVTVWVGTDVEYAPYVEMGTSKQAAQPYLRPALNENRQDIIDSVEKIFQEILRRNAKG